MALKNSRRRRRVDQIANRDRHGGELFGSFTSVGANSPTVATHLIKQSNSAAPTAGLRNGRARPQISRAEIDVALVALVARHGAKIIGSAMRYSLCREDADDAYQRGLEILITKAPTTNQEELVRWLHTVVKHEALAIRRQRKRTVQSEDIDHSLVPGEWRTPEDRVTAAERVERASEAIRELKPHEMQCLVLKASGFSYNEIAQRNGWTWTKVNRCISEGRANFLSAYESIEVGERCELLEPLISAFADDEVGEEDRKTVSRHVRSCPTCRARLREYRSAPARVAGLVPPILLGMPLAHGTDDSSSAATGLAARHVHDGYLASAHDSIASALRAARDSVRLLVNHGTDSVLGRVIAPFSTDATGISTAAKVCTGAACVLIAGGAATIGIQKGHADKQRAASKASADDEAGSMPLTPSLTGGPGSLPGELAQPPEQPTGTENPSGDAAKPKPDDTESNDAEKQPSVQSGFEPDDAGAPVQSQHPRPGGQTPSASRAAPQGSSKPPVGGSEEFQP